MPTIPSLSGSYIDQTYHRLVQVSGSSFADGDGNPITLAPGSVNPTSTYLPFNNTGVFADSYLNQTSSILRTTSGSNNIGLKLDFANKFFGLGDYNITGQSIGLIMGGSSGSESFTLYDTEANPIFLSGLADVGLMDFGFFATTNRTQFRVDDNSGIFTKYQDNPIGLKLDFVSNFYKLGNSSTGVSVDLANQIYQFGDYDYGGASGTNIFIDNTTSIIKTRYNGSNTDIGLKLDFASNSYKLGDHINDKGLFIFPTSNIYQLGDFSGGGGSNINVSNTGITLSQGDAKTVLSIQTNRIFTSTDVLGETGLNLDFASQIYTLGYNTTNNTKLVINDATQTIIVTGSAFTWNSRTVASIDNGSATHIPFFSTNNILSTSSIYQSGSTSIIINSDVNTTANPEALFVEQTHPTSFNVISGKGNLNNYLQLNIQNRNAGTSVSSDVVATANNGDENGNYIDMGINGSNFIGPVGNANDAYLYTTGSHLHIGNATPNMPVQFFAGGFDTDVYRKFELNTNNQHNMTGSLNISGSLNVRNNITSSGILTNGNNNILGNITISGSSTIQGTTTMTGSLLITGSTTQVGNNTLVGDTLLSGSITISGSFPVGSYSSSVNIYGDTTMTGYLKFNPYSTNIDTSISASYIFVSGSTNDLYFAQNEKGYSNITRLRWLEGNLYTGLLNGGVISATPGSTTYQVQSGSGIIINLNASFGDNPYPTAQYINWPTLTANIAPLSASYDQQFVAINSTANISTQGTPYSDGDYNTKIPIGIVIHQNRSTINAVQTFPSVGYGWKQRSSDFIRAFGPLKISGYTLQPSSSLGLLLDGGTAFVDGRNYIVDPNNPSYINEATGITTSKIYYYYQSGSEFKYDTNGGVGYTNVTASLYSNNGVLTPLFNNNKWSIQRVYYFPNSATKAFYIYYGNVEYNDYAAALAGISTEAFREAPNTAANAIFIGYMLLQKTADFTTTPGSTGTWEFRAGGLFRGVGGGGASGGGGGGATTLAGLTDVSITSPTNGQPLVYNTSTTKWSNSNSLTASLNGTASWAQYVVNGSGASFPYTGSATITGSLVITGSTTSTLGFTGSLFGTSSWAYSASQAVSSSYATSASYATTASVVLGSVTTAATASYSTDFTVASTLTLQSTLTDFYTIASTGPGINNLFTKNTGSFTSAFCKYTMYQGANSRAGEFVTSWNGTTVSYYDNSTVDIGNTSAITFTSAIVSGQVQISTGNTTPSGWTVKMLATFI